MFSLNYSCSARDKKGEDEQGQQKYIAGKQLAEKAQIGEAVV